MAVGTGAGTTRLSKMVVKWFMRSRWLLLRRPVVLRTKHGLTFECSPSEWALRELVDRKKSERVLNDDPALIEYLARAVKPGYTVLDVGALIGATCLVSAARAGPSGRVYAFEAATSNYCRLCHHIQINRVRNVIPLKLAVFSRHGEVVLNIFPSDRRGWHSLARYEHKGWAPVTSERVSSIALDRFCSERGIHVVDLIKLDIEGAEADAFEGARSLLRAHALRRIVFELSPVPLNAMGRSVASVIGPLTSNGYGIYRIERTGSLTGPITVGQPTGPTNFVALAPGIVP